MPLADCAQIVHHASGSPQFDFEIIKTELKSQLTLFA